MYNVSRVIDLSEYMPTYLTLSLDCNSQHGWNFVLVLVDFLIHVFYIMFKSKILHMERQLSFSELAFSDVWNNLIDQSCQRAVSAMCSQPRGRVYRKQNNKLFTSNFEKLFILIDYEQKDLYRSKNLSNQWLTTIISYGLLERSGALIFNYKQEIIIFSS